MSGHFLGVACSALGRAWRARTASAEDVLAIQRSEGLSEPLARAIVARGVSPETVGDYLRPSLRNLFPNPSAFKDMDEAARALIAALQSDSDVWVLADYDVDGGSSAALLVRWFREMGRELSIYVPDRLAEGYGPSPLAFQRMKAAGAELVVTVDCGAAAYDALESAADLGVQVVVVDHHLMRGAPPRARAVVNPNRQDDTSGQGNLAAAGVVFVLLAALNREARAQGLFADRAEPDIRRWLDLAAMGAICDVTALTGFNRGLTSLGLQVMSRWENPGLRALMAVSGSELVEATPFHAGFVLGPRINAGGRIGRSDLGARLLASDDPDDVAALAAELDGLNRQRREVEQEITEAAIRQVEQQSNFDPAAPVILAAGEGWHPGVIGVVAGRLKERWRRPVVVVGLDEVTGIGKGSGRSIAGVNLGRAVQDAFDEGLLMAGGGHAMAAGLTIRSALIPDFRDFLSERLAAESEAAIGADALEIDVLASASAVDRQMYEAFQVLAPFGPGNPEPTYVLAGVTVRDARVLNNGHVSCRLADPDGRQIRAIAWRAAETEVGKALLAGGGALDVAGVLKADDWNGRRGVQFEILDVHDPRRAV